jgi:tellurite resistance protein TerB
MGFFDNLKTKAKEMSASLAAEAKRFKNKNFHQAVVASCALIAYADGTVTADEKKKMGGFLKINEAMKVFDADTTITLFNNFIEHLEFDLDIGTNECLVAIGKIKNKDSESRAVVRIACAIGAADGDFDDTEKAAVRKICGELGVSPSEFDL